MAEPYYIQVRIKKQTEVGEFNDAIYFTQSEYDALSQPEIEAMKTARKDAWVDRVKNPPVYVEPSKEALQFIRVDLEEQMDAVMTKLFDKASKKELQDIKEELQANMDELDASILTKEIV